MSDTIIAAILPLEWTNLADDERYADVLVEHRRWWPKEEAAPIPDLKQPACRKKLP